MVNASSKQSDISLEYYLKELSHSHPLSAAEEFELAVKMKRGDLKARDRLIKANLRFVVNVALKYRNQGVALADLISAGNMGLITATERFDETRGFKFISYAVWWIRQSILQTLAEQGRMIRLPINRLDLLRRIKNFSDEYQGNEGHMPTEAEIANEFHISEDQVIDMLSHSPIVFSLDKPIHDEDTTLIDLMHDKDQVPPDAEMFHNALRDEVNDLLHTLDNREADVIRLYFGLNGASWTLQAIANKYSLTRERVRQIKEKALRKLRHPSRGR
ncbi:MAG: RNA polymerase sigma factor RpoD/SigA, partial [Candidatus Latescibacteria bacterium]|nr:RNA polymerase sigma factor RpoD/SigA [Candidatus Latescibacterota bacterium]